MKIKKLDHLDVLSTLPDRNIAAHKGDFGRILLLCGSVGYTGAVALAAMGALRAGAGLVYLGVPESIYTIEAQKLLEPIVMPLPEQDGMLSKEAVKRISELLPRMDAVLVGCGLGQSDGTLAVTEYVMKHFDGTVILDADSINVLKGHMDILRDRTGCTILTPHQGEFCKISGPIRISRSVDAQRFATNHGCIVVLKGHETVITDGISTFINTTGNPGMAVGGSGDVLAGIITALIGQGIEPLKAAACGVWLHGAAGDICAAEIGQYGMLPSDMIDVLPRLMK